jgi:hypothetical protein
MVYFENAFRLSYLHQTATCFRCISSPLPGGEVRCTCVAANVTSKMTVSKLTVTVEVPFATYTHRTAHLTMGC